VSSGRANPPADEWLAGERAQRIEALGFAIDGQAENYRREVRLASPADFAQVAAAVADVFYDGFDYRGATAIRASLHVGGRSQTRRTLDAVTPQDLGKLLARARFRVKEVHEPEDGSDEHTLLRCRYGQTWTSVSFGHRVDDQNLFRAARLTCALDPLPDLQPSLFDDDAACADDGGPPGLHASLVLSLSGGVTVDWIMARLFEWREVLDGHRREMRRQLLGVGEMTPAAGIH
jgi:hypothetical protein